MTEVVIAYGPFFVWMLHAVVDVGGVGDVEMQAFVTLLPVASRTVPVIVLGCFVPVLGSGAGDAVRTGSVRSGVGVAGVIVGAGDGAVVGVGDADGGSWITGELDARGDGDGDGAVKAGTVGDAMGAGGGTVSIRGVSPSSSTIAAEAAARALAAAPGFPAASWRAASSVRERTSSAGYATW